MAHSISRPPDPRHARPEAHLEIRARSCIDYRQVRWTVARRNRWQADPARKWRSRVALASPRIGSGNGNAVARSLGTRLGDATVQTSLSRGLRPHGGGALN